MSSIRSWKSAYQKHSRACLTSLFIIAASVIILSALAVKNRFENYELDFMLSFVPDALNVHSVLYAKEESWGFGPGGNEAGVRVYPLAEVDARLVREGGADYLANLPPNQSQDGRRWRGVYREWQETPIKPSQKWLPDRKTELFRVYDYLCGYGFCLKVEKSVIDEITSIVNSPGSYYAYGRIGLIIVSPSQKKVIYLYNG